MSSPQENTKIEQLVESIESFARIIARGMVVADHVHPSRLETSEQIAILITDARAEMATALRDFLKPSLRVVTHTAGVEANRTALVDAIAKREKPIYPGGIDDLQLG